MLGMFPALFGLATLLYAVLRYIVVDAGVDGGHDFRYYYILASMLRDGIDYAALSSSEFVSLADTYLQGASYPQDSPDVVYHTPTLLIALIPLSYLSPHMASAVWGVISLVLYVLGIWYVLRSVWDALPHDEMKRMLFISCALFLVAIYYPFHLGLHLGQVDVLIFFFLSLSYYHLVQGNRLASGVFAGLLCCVKPAAVLLLPFWLMHRKSLLGVVIIGVLSLVAVLFLLGITFFENYLSRVFLTTDYFFQHKLLGIGNISLLAFIGRFLDVSSDHYDVLKWLSHLFALACLAGTAYLGRVYVTRLKDGVDLLLPLAVCVWMLAMPQMELIYMIVALLPLLVVMSKVFSLSVRSLFVLAISMLLLSLSYSFDRYELFQSGILSVFKATHIFALLAIATLLFSEQRKVTGG